MKFSYDADLQGESSLTNLLALLLSSYTIAVTEISKNRVPTTHSVFAVSVFKFLIAKQVLTKACMLTD